MTQKNNQKNNQQNIGKSDLSSYQDFVLGHLDQLRGRKLIVVGDVGVDEYVLGTVGRISPEAPVPVVDVQSEEARIGLAGNVAQNVASLGGEALMVGVVGDDSSSNDLRKLFDEAGVDSSHLLTDGSRPTTRKMRVMAEHHHIVRVDYEKRKYLDEGCKKALLAKVEKLLPAADAVIIEDYAKGVLSEDLCQSLIHSTHKAGKKVLVDPHISTPVHFYRGADLFTPNRLEAFEMSKLKFDELNYPEDALIQVGEKLLADLETSQLVITQGKQGMSLFSGGEVTHMPTYARQVFDVTGAGDTVIAALGLAWVSGCSLEQACVLANYAAGFVVGKVGCVSCHSQDLRNYIEEHRV